MSDKKSHHAADEDRVPTRERRYIERRHWMDGIKVATGCADCGLWGPPEALAFDHVRGEKVFNIGQSWNQGRVALVEEMAKCEIVCANCHAIRTKKRNKDGPVFEPFQKIPRLTRECAVTEKLDGTNGTVWVDGELDVWAGSRNKWLPRGGGRRGEDNYGFAAWVAEHEEEFAGLGPCLLHGEWWGNGIQRGYGLPAGDKRFSLFNVNRWDVPERPECCYLVPVLYRGLFDTRIVDEIVTGLKVGGSAAAPGFAKPEGVVVWHDAARKLFKKTCVDDDYRKDQRVAA